MSLFYKTYIYTHNVYVSIHFLDLKADSKYFDQRVERDQRVAECALPFHLLSLTRFRTQFASMADIFLVKIASCLRFFWWFLMVFDVLFGARP